MSTNTKVVLGILGAAALVWILPFGTLFTWILLAAIVGVPVAGYLMLDPSQRRKLRARGRGEIGR